MYTVSYTYRILKVLHPCLGLCRKNIFRRRGNCVALESAQNKNSRQIRDIRTVSGSLDLKNKVFREKLTLYLQGLTRAWTDPIVCSPITGRLITTFLGVPARLITILPPGETRIIDSVEAVLPR
jgi:hypothetical protein